MHVRQVGHCGVSRTSRFRDGVVERQFREHVLDLRCNVVDFGLLRNVGGTMGRVGTAFVGHVATGEDEGDEGFVGRGSEEGVGTWYMLALRRR